MNQSTRRYIIQYVSGTKANQTEEFDADKYTTLHIGREVGNDIGFDPDLDLAVSRQHATITTDPIQPGNFVLTDISRNGTWVNGQRVNGSISLSPGDEIQLGTGGPSIIFDLTPRPQTTPATRLMSVGSAETQEFQLAEAPAPTKVGIGKQTFERAISQERKRSGRLLWASLAGLLVVVSAIAFVNYTRQKKDMDDVVAGRDSLNAVLNKEIVSLRSNLTELEEKAKNQPLSDTEIGALVMDKVVKFEMSWGLFDVQTGEPIWQLYLPDSVGGNLPAFIQRPDGNAEPYLFHPSKQLPGMPVGQEGSGSGFLVSNGGLLLTNRHVAAGWNTRFNFPQTSQKGFGVLVRIGQKGLERLGIIERPIAWVPSESQLIDGRPGRIEGHNYYLNVIFPGSTNRRAATLSASSQIHDVSLVKVDLAQPIEPVQTFDNYQTIPKGEGVVVIGYPGVTPELIKVRKSNDPFKPNSTQTTVANPTMTSGTITNLLKSSTDFDNNYSQFGDYYQLSINATGPGNSGGPMFNRKGQVIGIYSAGSNGPGGEHVSFAIPIKYGLELLNKN